MSYQHENPTDPAPHDEHRHPTAGGASGPSPRFIAAIVLGAIILLFILGNGHQTRINFLLFKWDTTVRWSIFIAVLLGVALDRLVLWAMRRRKSKKADDSE